MVCLALYAWGSNYCVLAAASARSTMACMTVAKPAEAKSCCHHAPAQKSSERAAAKPSCCPDPVVAPATPAPDDARALIAAVDIVLADALASAPPTAAAWHGHRALPEGRLPTRLLCAPLPARAPPLT